MDSGSKNADQQDLPGSGGQIVAITSGEVGYVFRQNQITRMDFVGGATVFRFVPYHQIEVLFMVEQFVKMIVEYFSMLMMVFLKLMVIMLLLLVQKK